MDSISLWLSITAVVWLKNYTHAKKNYLIYCVQRLKESSSYSTRKMSTILQNNKGQNFNFS